MRPSIVTTFILPDAGASVLNSFIRHHLRIGFDCIFLFYDGDSTSTTSNKIMEIVEPFKSHVMLILRSDDLIAEMRLHCGDLWLKIGDFYLDEITVRQQLHAEYAMKVLAPMHGCTWLLHIDIDELFYINTSVVPSVKVHYTDLEHRGVFQLTYANHEGLPESFLIGDYFKEVSLFRRNHMTLRSTIGLAGGAEFAKAAVAMHRFSDRTHHGQYMLFYDNGKSAARVGVGAHSRNPHEWTFDSDITFPSFSTFTDMRRLRADRTLHDLVDIACILHYPCCGFEWFVDKYRTLGAFPDAWMGGTVPIAPSFHRDARDCLLRGEADAEVLYRSQVMLQPGDVEVLDSMLAVGVLVRIREVSDALLGLEGREESLHRMEPPSSVSSARLARLAPEYRAAAGYDKASIIAQIAREFL